MVSLDSMKSVVNIFIIFFSIFIVFSCNDNENIRPSNQESVLQLRCDPIPIVRIGFIGLGQRGSEAVKRYTYLDDVNIKAICDIEKEKVDNIQRLLTERGLSKADEYVGEYQWKKLCERDDIDLVYICTDWLKHARMAVYAMEHGKHVAVEVPAATTVKDCWNLVNTAERTQRHCMMLENCCYDFFELNSLNMIKDGIIGEVIHGEGAYIHDLRELYFSALDKNASNNIGLWRLKFKEEHTGNPYPTHGLGPICQAMNIHRGDKMNYLVSVSSKQLGMTEYAKRIFGKNSPESLRPYKLGDMNTTIIKTEKGRTILIQHNVTTPRPYDRLYKLYGTKGFVCKYPTPGITIEPHSNEFITDSKLDSLLKKYEHPLIKELGEYAKKVGGHGGMDFIMDYRLIYCLKNGLPLDQDVYDAAEWSCLVELTEKSVLENGKPVKIPDFTRGDWNKLNSLDFFY